MRRTLALFFSLLLLGACTDSPSGQTGVTPAPIVSAASTPAAEPTMPPQRRTTRVPHVVGMSVPEAKATVAAQGLRAHVRDVEHSACVKPRVLRQYPLRGWRRDVGTKVRLDVSGEGMGPCGLDLPPAGRALDAAGRAFVGFARGGRPDRTLLGNAVDLYLGGRLLHTIPSQRAMHRRSYDWLCPTSGSYSARVCPFSAVRAIAMYPGPMAVTSDPPRPPCGGDRFLAARFSRTVTLTPDEGRSCFDYFAVEIAVSADLRLEAVNLIWSEP